MIANRPTLFLIPNFILLLRRISTHFTIAPDIVEAMYDGAKNNSHNTVPNHQEINQHQLKLQQLYQVNPNFKKFGNNLYKAYNNPKVKSIIIAFERQENLDGLEKNPYFQPSLISISLLQAIGIVPFYNKQNSLVYALVNKDNISAISGHQDSIFLKPEDKYLNLIPTLLLVNGYSQSNAKTWIKESVDVVTDFKKKYPISYEILKKINFVCKSKSINEIGSHLPHKIIEKNDEIKFISNFVYTPIPTDLASFNISKEDAYLAIFRFRELINLEKNRYEFVMNNQKGQFLIIKNRDAIHGRDSIEEELVGKRLLIAYAFQDQQKPSRVLQTKIDAIKISEQKFLSP